MSHLREAETTGPHLGQPDCEALAPEALRESVAKAFDEGAQDALAKQRSRRSASDSWNVLAVRGTVCILVIKSVPKCVKARRRCRTYATPIPANVDHAKSGRYLKSISEGSRSPVQLWQNCGQ